MSRELKKLNIFMIGIFLCIAVYIGVFIGRNTISDHVFLTQTHGTSESQIVKRMNLNRATADDLCTLPGVGATLSRAIIEYREKYGDYVDIDELLDIEGMTRDLFLKIKDYITV